MYITEYKEEFKKDFIDLNMEWITRYFTCLLYTSRCV